MAKDVNNIKFLNTHNALRNVYSLKNEYSQNSKNSIEDPIFTGFTLSIDTLHSPLFFTGEPGDTTYDNVTDTLRSAEGSDTSLADKIEEKLKKMYELSIVGFPNTYEIRTISAKDPFGTGTDSRKPGYGLQEWYYMDNVLYGAVDYIYMVDKVTDSTYSPDAEGVTDIGNGTPDKSEFSEMDEKLNELSNLNIYFEYDRDEVWNKEIEKYTTLVNTLKAQTDVSVKLFGYASKELNDDSKTAHNLDLSRRRVETVKGYLINNGIESSRITAAYYGETKQFSASNLESNRVVVCNICSQGDALDVQIQLQEGSITDEMKTKHNNLGVEIYGKKEDGEDGPVPYTKTEIDDAIKNKTAPIVDERGIIHYELLGLYGKYLERYHTDEYQKKLQDIKDFEDELESHKIAIRNEMEGFQSAMQGYENTIKNTSNDKETARTGISDEFTAFNNFVTNKTSYETIHNSPDNIKFDGSVDYKVAVVKENDTEKLKSELEGLKNITLNPESDKNILIKAWCVMKSSLLEVKVSSKGNTDLQKLKKEKEEIEKKIYGKHSDGRIGTEQDPAPGSIYYEYITKLEEYNTDDVSQKEYAVAEMQAIKENIGALNAYNEAASKKSTITRNPSLPSVDYEARQKIQRPKYEVPQTVYDMLGFIRGMKSLTDDHPYVFQSISGLDEAYKKYFELKDPFQGSGDDKITIDCLEFLDLRVTSMFNKYFNAVYDRQFRRERVPVNLRRFNCSIFVHDIRNFRNSIDAATAQYGDLKSITEFALNYISAIEFKFFDCEIVPTETGGLFESVSNNSAGDMRGTKFTFTYGNCAINFLPFEDLRKYILEDSPIEPVKNNNTIKSAYTEQPDGTPRRDGEFREDYLKVKGTGVYNDSGKVKENSLQKSKTLGTTTDETGNNILNTEGDGNFRRWFDRSDLGNVNNNDYRDYIRHDSYVAVDDHYKTTVVNNFALGSVAQKNKELTAMDDALRRIVTGISASTGIPTNGVADALNVGFLKSVFNEQDLAAPIAKDLGNVTNSKVVSVDTMEYIGKVVGQEEPQPNTVTDLGSVDNESYDTGRTPRLGNVNKKGGN